MKACSSSNVKQKHYFYEFYLLTTDGIHNHIQADTIEDIVMNGAHENA